MDKRARAYLELDPRVAPDWKFYGFTTPGLADMDVLRSWEEYREHGVLLVAGGYLDQPPEWWRDMETCEMLYRTRLLVNEPEAIRKIEDKAKRARGS